MRELFIGAILICILAFSMGQDRALDERATQHDRARIMALTSKQ